MSKSFLRMAELTLPSPVPEAPEQIAMLATNIVIDDVVKGRVTYLLLLTFRGTRLRLWQLHNAPSPDDVVRPLIQRDEPEAIAFVHPIPLPPGVEGERGYNVAMESPAGKFDALIALWGGPGPGGEWMRIYGQHGSNHANRWFGVDPEDEIDMWFEGVVGAIGQEGDA